MNNMDLKFVDLKTGNLFDGSYPYVFWFDGQQSTNLIYSKPICFISNYKDIRVEIESNPIFSLANVHYLSAHEPDNINGIKYQRLENIQTNSVQTVYTRHHNYFVHIFYVLCVSGAEGEAHENINIYYKDMSRKITIEVGADFYSENESLYINLANNGVEIPEQIQKALYTTNIHEDKRDNITLNRKWKELLSNYMDVVGCKGSYKSLINSLKWFEYGDLVRLKEIWKMSENSIDRLTERDLLSTTYNNYSEVLNEFAKTTYIALYCAMKKIEGDSYDEEGNPVLKDIAFDWGLKDMMLKLCMLGNFYETYFMPIHLDLIHATIEDVVYTNTFKHIGGGTINREDYFNPTKSLQCNINDGDIYQLSVVECYVTDETLFGASGDGPIIGVQRFPLTNPSDQNISNEILGKYFKQLYKEVGAIVPVNINLQLAPNDYIKKETIWFKTFNNGPQGWYKCVDNKIFANGNILFNLLCPREGEYEARVQFESAGGELYNKVIKFNVIDNEHIGLKLYKVKNNKCPLNLPNKMINHFLDKNNVLNHPIIDESRMDRKSNEYMINRVHSTNYDMFVQYIPSKNINPYHDGKNWDGVCLNHLVVLEGDGGINPELIKSYYTTKKIIYEGDGKTIKKVYTICLSRNFGHIMENSPYYTDYKYYGLPVYKSNYIYVADFHRLVEIGNNIYNDADSKYYTITDDDVLCVVPDISFGKYISEYDWEFKNDSTGEVINIKNTREPFIANKEDKPLSNGYYSVKFRYRLTNENIVNEINLNSAFIKI